MQVVGVGVGPGEGCSAGLGVATSSIRNPCKPLLNGADPIIDRPRPARQLYREGELDDRTVEVTLTPGGG
jgi:hypothetical protein